MKNRLPVENAGDTDVCLSIEPYGEDFWLKPREAFTVVPMSVGNVQFTVVVATSLITVWLYEDGDPHKVMLDYKVFDASGEELKCGHRRPTAPAGS
ncbi:hypothetical protein OG548_31100 [Streptomyces sp. NBC_01356]|uniref:hypothetical protein n=1 Tax=Streptomyces sp. NBC_01356 TaxID=2903836 RepID=UPI002E302739|nr:hypothetical protein [Streptomyces sp. NBC_01356]